MHPQSIVRITSAVFPVTARRVVAPYSSDDTSPATMSWVDIVARKAIANSHKPHPLRTNRGLVGLHGKHQPINTVERKATSHQQQFLNHPLRKERSEWSKNKVLAELLSRSDSPKGRVLRDSVTKLSFFDFFFQIFRILQTLRHVVELIRELRHLIAAF